METEPITDGDKGKLRMKVLADQLGISMDEVTEKNYSKKQLKRMMRDKMYHQQKIAKRQIQKVKKKLKRQDLKQQNLLKPKKKDIRVSMYSSPNQVKVAIDLSFNQHMGEKELRKLFKQIQRCYSCNRRSPAPCQFYLTSVTGQTADIINEKQPGFRNWEIHQEEKHFLEVFKDHREKGTLVFLSPNSPNVLPDATEIQRRNGDYVYMIGGLVDHNVQKGLTLKIAEENGIQHARLPIDQCIQLFTSHVLSVNHVFELMLSASQGLPWSEAFLQIIPQRKQNRSKEVLALIESNKLKKKEEEGIVDT
ncbi:tRNA methyltransferase 10 homolog A isoform X2 [Brevipalpus obovatus]|uniref:tRNA methyltransferase 10 homolog A isoform X2 n=1 Tax=Brevipalpus obovatus TaxID=246614 RepID=UPI003D9F2A39